jgi:hypothetical protein
MVEVLEHHSSQVEVMELQQPLADRELLPFQQQGEVVAVLLGGTQV